MTGRQSKFATRSRANAGAKMVLQDPISRQPSSEFLIVRGVDSDAFRKARREGERAMVNLDPSLSQADRQSAVEAHKQRMLASLVAGWSFEEDASEENVIAFLEEAPYIADALDRFASDRSNFLASGSDSSASSSSES